MTPPRSLLQGFSSLVAGVVFGIGLAVAQMTDPVKVLNFLDITGTWDASLLFVLGGAAVFSAAVFRWVQLQPAPVFDTRFHLPKSAAINARLLTGAAIFGIGWGIAGYCPGPAIASLAFGNLEVLWLLPALLAGQTLQRCIDELDSPRTSPQVTPLDV